MTRRNSTRAFIPGVALVLLTACGGSSTTEPTTPAAPAKPVPVQADDLPEGALARADVVRHVDAGLGNFLQRARVEASLEEGRFVGFRIVELLPDGFWRNTDLKEGDVVTHVNQTSVEDPNQVYEVFESLREAPAIEVRVLRDGHARKMTFPIVGPPAPKKQTVQ